MNTILLCIGNRTLRMSKKTPVLDKVQGKMAGVLKEENWPNPRERELMRRQSGRNEREKIRRGGFKNGFIVENVKRNVHAR